MANKLPKIYGNFIKLILQNSALVGISLILLALSYCIIKRWRNFKKSIWRFKSPLSFPYINLDYEGNLEILTDHIKTYGKTIWSRVWFRTTLYTSDYDLISLIFNNDNFIKEPIHWNTGRCLWTDYFTEEILKDLVGICEENGKILANKLEAVCEKSIDIHKFISFCTLDIILETIMGIRVHTQENGHLKNFKLIKQRSRQVLEKEFSENRQKDNYYNVKNQALTMLLKKLLKHEENQEQKDAPKLLEKKKIVTQKAISQEVDAFMIAGSDTAASAISFTLFCLAKYPDVQMEVLEEQRRIFHGKFDRDVTLEDLNEMTYLGQVIMEALRLYPSVPIYSRQLANDIFYDGYYLPRGLNIVMLIYELNRSPKYFDEPELFKPDRFEKKKLKNMPEFSYFLFDDGPKNCYGERKALFLEMRSIVSRLVRTYHILPTIFPHQPKLFAEGVLVSKNGINVILKKREFV